MLGTCSLQQIWKFTYLTLPMFNVTTWPSTGTTQYISFKRYDDF